MTLFDQLFEFLRFPRRELSINGRKFYSYEFYSYNSVKNRDRSLDDEPIYRLRFYWACFEGGHSFEYDRFNYNNLWKLPNLEELVLQYFPFESFTTTVATQEEEETNQPNNNNNNINNNNNNNENANSLTETTTTTATPISIGHLSKTLKKLKIHDCRHNRFHLPPDIGMLVNLTELRLEYCDNLTCLPLEIGGLQSLQIFVLEDLYKLQLIPSEIGNLVNLKELQIGDCKSLVGLPKEIGGLQSLQTFQLCKLESLQSLPTEIGNLSNLKLFKIYSCNSLVRLPKEIGKLKSLQELEIRSCDFLERLPIELNHIRSNLQKLEIYDNKLLEQTGFSFQRALTRSLSLVGHTQELPLSMWPVVLEDVRKQIGWMQNSQSGKIMEASVIFSLLQKGPTLLDRTISAASIDTSLDDTNITAETETATIPSEPIDDCNNKN